ncbi:thioredoxin TrxC [Roseibacterium sp. SDUM158017]|uniref:thioredoxin TrxC n=1 Tax=Roseicyclus salinarum TaxID=3036773 RepID=UPI0024152281|nr:thioredoxin TrxC [Roseibacterium sp. SDUM158017]MDG4647956.1 thioredoxin TrxC [Roseibacterium sp. SDUM158017]
MPDHRVTCLSCASVNRVPSDRLSAHPKCGTCGAKLTEGRVHDLDSETLRRAERNDTLPLVADFWAPWCGPCRMMAPEFEKAARALAPQARFAKLNTQVHGDASQRYGIRGIPLLILFRDGQEVARLTGARPAAEIEAFVRSHARTPA